MPSYDLEVILRSETDAASANDFVNNGWVFTGDYSTITYSDEDNFGLGDDAPNTETDAPAVITHVDGDPNHPLVGTDIFAAYVRTDNNDGDSDTNADVVFLNDGGFSGTFGIAQYPGSGWAMEQGDTFTSGFSVTDHPTGASWSTEGMLGGKIRPHNVSPKA